MLEVPVLTHRAFGNGLARAEDLKVLAVLGSRRQAFFRHIKTAGQGQVKKRASYLRSAKSGPTNMFCEEFAVGCKHLDAFVSAIAAYIADR